MNVKLHVTETDQCPKCPCKDKTIDHIICCPNALMKKKSGEITAALCKKKLG